MQLTPSRNGLGTLAVLGLLAAGAAQAASLTINSGDVAWNQDGNGTDVRIRYEGKSNAYYLNTNTSTNSPWISGVTNGLSSGSGWVREDEGNGTTYICRESTDYSASLVWSVALPQAIDTLTIQKHVSGVGVRRPCLLRGMVHLH